MELDLSKLMGRLTPNADQTVTVTKAEFVQVGAIAAAGLLTCEEASDLSDGTKTLLTAFCAMYHTEMEKMLFPSEETETKNNDQ